MRKKLLFIGIGFVLIALWFYVTLSSFPVDRDTFPNRIIISEGTVRTDSEVAEALSKEMGFDLEGAYKTGYTPMEVVEYLIKEPHGLDVVYYKGKLYVGRRTIPYYIPLVVCVIVALAGIVLVFIGLRSSRT